VPAVGNIVLLVSYYYVYASGGGYTRHATCDSYTYSLFFLFYRPEIQDEDWYYITFPTIRALHSCHIVILFLFFFRFQSVYTNGIRIQLKYLKEKKRY
jgi:hypothetical protein